MLTFGSLFAGIGGFDLGLERSGMVCKWQVEIDPFCQRVLAKHWPNVQRYSDVRECGSHNLEPVDVICGGFPCQPHSLAGRRKASNDDRDLWPEYARIICETKPTWILAENVPGILSSDDGRFYGRVLSDLAACGYDAFWRVFRAFDFGAPHIRERLFIVAHSREKRWDGREFQNSFYAEISQAKQGTRWSGKVIVDNRGSSRLVPSLPLFGMADGFSRGMDADKLAALGNSIVPHVAEFVGQCVVRHATQPSFAADH